MGMSKGVLAIINFLSTTDLASQRQKIIDEMA